MPWLMPPITAECHFLMMIGRYYLPSDAAIGRRALFRDLMRRRLLLPHYMTYRPSARLARHNARQAAGRAAHAEAT